MDLHWTTQTNKLASKVGLLLHTINSNNLTLEAAVYMINGHLIPNLEYRMKHMHIDEETLNIWDEKVIYSISQKITQENKKLFFKDTPPANTHGLP